jgi:hypothetical protein
LSSYGDKENGLEISWIKKISVELKESMKKQKELNNSFQNLFLK